MRDRALTGRTYEATVPDEPPIFTVVLDKNQLAWQRRATLGITRWYPSWRLPMGDDDQGAVEWFVLLARFAPLTVIHEGTP